MADPKHLAILEQGADAWNQWRRENSDTLPDLSGAKLSGANLSGADLSGADLFGADLSWADLSGADLRGPTLSES